MSEQSEKYAVTVTEAISRLEKRKGVAYGVQQPVIEIREEIDTYPSDGAYALMQVLMACFGSITPEVRKTMFGDLPAQNVTIETGPGRREAILWGDFSVPGIGGTLRCGSTVKDGCLIFLIGGTVSADNKDRVEELAELVRAYVARSSLYRGQAVRLTTNNDGELDIGAPPKFLDTSSVSEDDLFFSTQVQTDIKSNLFTLIEQTQACREAGVPLKRGILLEGKYGTGKTLTAFVTAQKAQRNGWTFILLDRVSGLKEAYAFARQYSPAIIFAEDVEREMGGERSVKVDDVLNNIDGLESKGTEIITVLTTNHVDRINVAMLRPGRLDAIITTHPPDGQAAEALVRKYARGLIPDTADLTAVSEALTGQIPAVIREVVERAKLYAIARVGGSISELGAADILLASRTMRAHLELLNPKPVVAATSTEEALGAAVKEVVKNAIVGNGLYSRVQEIHSAVDRIEDMM
jgi:transitional endoplasmic reticulum ATPase